MLHQLHDHTYCNLLQHFLQGHVDDTVNMELDCLLDFIREIAVSEFVNFLRVQRRLDGMYLLFILEKLARRFVDEVCWPSKQCVQILLMQ